MAAAMGSDKRSKLHLRASSIRLRFLKDDIRRLDKIMTLAQVQRHYFLSFEDLIGDPDFLYRRAKISPLNTSSLRLETTFMTFSGDGEARKNAELLQWQPGWKLAHLAGTAELRLRLGVERSLGKVEQPWILEGGFGDERPDAEWLLADGRRVAVEYDAGYPPAVVREKLRAFSRYDMVYWGTPSSTRQHNLQSRYPGQAEFLSLDFFTPAGQ